jgi:signal transduction histidine kinase/CheY-like chemotaxis protein
MSDDGNIRVWQFVRIDLQVTVGELMGQHEDVPLPLTPPKGLRPMSPFQMGNLQGAAPTESEQTLTLSSPTLQSSDVWLIVAQDTTTQQQLSKELAAKNADLVQLNRFKDEFLACISHELKTPLTAVLGLSHLLKNQSLGHLNQRQARYTHLIHESGRHLMAIVNDILDLTRIETGQLDLNLATVSVQAVCQQAIQQAAELHVKTVEAEETAVDELEAAIALDLDPTIDVMFADELRLQQMLTHLLSNALKFTESEDQMGLRVKSWGSWIAFTVWDTGIGIPEHQQHLIFQKFQQLANPMTRQVGGTGLGLVLTQRLARLHGGDVTFTSTEGKGSEFTLLLPPAPPEVQLNLNLDLATTLQKPSANRLVLIVEAVPRFIDDLTDKLSQLGYQIAIARSGPEALEKTRRLQPHVTLLNPLLPMLSGWDVLTLLKSDPETCDIPVLVTATPVERDQAMTNGADGFLTLPIDADRLQELIEQLEQRQDDPDHLESLQGLTALYLNAEDEQAQSGSMQAFNHQLNQLLHHYHCHLLEADDLDQAEMIARVWKPSILLISPCREPLAYLQQLRDREFLATLPIIPLATDVTTIVQELPQLKLFPCQTGKSSTDPQMLEPTVLIKTMQMATGRARQPHVLIVDPTQLDHPHDHVISPASRSLETLAYYLQAAGFQGRIGQSWQDVEQQVRYRTADVMLVALPENWPQSDLLTRLEQIQQIDACPPIFALSHQKLANSNPQAEKTLQRITYGVVSSSISVRDLLNQIHQALHQA